MQKNLDLKGRIIRAVLGGALLFYAWWATSLIALLAALFTFFEAFMSWCVVYHFLGINHCPLKRDDSQGTKKE